MNDWNKNILAKYDFEVNSIRKGRGCYICDTEQGPKIIQEYCGQEEKIVAEAVMHNILNESGIMTDRPLKNTEGFYCTHTERGGFLMRDWFSYEECPVGTSHSGELRAAVRTLAKLHRLLSDTGEAGVPYEKNMRRLDSEMARYWREMKHIGKYIKGRKQKNAFEQSAAESFPYMAEQAEEAIRLLSSSSAYEEKLERALAHHSICHGNYHYHNVLMCRDGGTEAEGAKKTESASAEALAEAAVIDWVGMGIQVQLYDLYHFMRKALEKTQWDIRLGDSLLNEYAACSGLSHEDLEILYCLFLFPLKYRKQLNHYFAGNKVWIPAKDAEKMTKCIAQESYRRNFIRTIFSSFVS